MKRLISILLSVALLVCAVPAAAADSLVISPATELAASGEEITLVLDLHKNPGIASWTLTLDWDADALQLNSQSIKIGDTFAGGMSASNSDAPGQLRLAWASLENVSGDGALVTVSFTVSESAAADTYPIAITTSGVSNQAGEVLSVTTSDALVTLPEKEQPTSHPNTPGNPEQNKPTAAQLKEDAPVSISFSDVPETAFYYQPTLWAAEQGITAGTAPGLFSPDTPCDRAQAVTFLWRAYGSPEPRVTATAFTDVSPDAFYYKAVLWAVEQGITTGTSETTFSPNATITRAQIAAFLYRSIQATGGGFQGAWMFYIPFRDMPDWAFEAIAWCYMKGITTGTSETTFSPDAPCTRGQIVTFLYRTFAEHET